MGADGNPGALNDANLEWKDIQFAFGGSYEVSNPDAVTRLVGLTGIPFTNVFNACATAASSSSRPPRRSGRASTTSASRWGSTSIPRGAFTDDPPTRAASLVRRERASSSPPSSSASRPTVHPRPRHLATDTGQSRGQELPQRRAEPERLPAQADFRRRDPRLRPAELSTDAVHVLRSGRGRGSGDHVPRRHRARYTSHPVFLRATAIRTRRFGAYEVHARGPRSTRTFRRPSTPPVPPTRRPESGRRTSTSSSFRTPTRVPR